MASTYLTRTFQSGGNRKKWTYSVWFKRSRISASSGDDMLFQSYVSTYTYCPIQTDDTLRFRDGSGGNKRTHMKFRDCNAWYHLVVAIDTDLSTAGDRYKIYVNGTRLTDADFETNTNPSQGYEGEWNKAQLMNIGRHSAGESYFDGLMSHIHFCDGYQYQASDFGETDATTGEWKIKTSPNVSYGTTGFFILKDGNTVTDSSSNSNTWTANGTLTKTEDSPSNVFATLNPLWTQESTRVPTLTLGNNMFSGGSSSTWYQTIGTLGFSSGKYYWEAKYNAGTNLGKNLVGAVGIDGMSSGKFYEKTPSVFYKNEDGGETRVNNSQSSGNYGTLAQNDILGCAIDMDASTPTATFYKNGSALVSNVSLTGFAGKTIVPAVSTYSSGEFQMNFGNGYFGTTAVSSAGTNASGNGIFEYDVPSGYTALSTKGLNL